MRANVAILLLLFSSPAWGQSADISKLEATSWPSIVASQMIEGTLAATDVKRDDGSYVDGYYYQAKANERVTFTMRSGQLDSWLVIDDPSGKLYQWNDDDGGGSDARLTVTFPHDGRYLILANCVTSATGSYSLSAEPAGK